jgi:two-component system sensor histidine kinase KdpD
MVSEIKKSHYLFCIVIVIGVAALCYPFMDWIGYRSVALLLLLTVSILAMRFSLYPVLFAAAFSALIWDFFFIPPHFTLTVGSGEDTLLLIMYFIVALLSGVFNLKLRQFEKIARQKEEREHAIRLYNTLFNTLSHELRTPIATILGATDALNENEERLSKQDKKELVSEISSAALRLNKQLENLLNSSRLESGVIRPNFEWCDVNELIYNSLNKIQNSLDNHQVTVNIDEDLPLVKLDFGLMEQVLNNLLMNSANYTPPNSAINLSAYLTTEREGDYSDGNLSYTKQEASHKLIIEVSDNGPGIPEEEMTRIFNKFYRIKDTKTGGTGLGLYIVKGFIEAQGGQIRVLSNPTGGTFFIIEIPTPILIKNIHHESV